MTGEEYLKLHGINQKSIEKFGLRVEGNKLVIPIRDENGNVVYNKYRMLDYDENDPKSNKFKFDNGSKASLFNMQALKNKKNYVFLCEGEMDCIRLEQEGQLTVSGTAGASTFKDEWVEHFKNRVVFICYDNDKTGQDNVLEVAKKLTTAGIKVRIVNLPKGCKDICEFFAKGYTRQEFTNLCKEAKEVKFDNSKLNILGFELNITDPTAITISKDGVTYRIASIKDYRVDISVFYDNRLCNREVFLLTSGKSRAGFIKNCHQVDETIKNQILAHLVEIPNVLDELNRKQINDTQNQEEQPTEGAIAVARKLLQSPTLVCDILLAIQSDGVVGEEENILAHYFTFTSRLLDDPLSEIVKGESSAGKSYTLLKVMRFIPAIAYRDITDATPQSFYYVDKDYFTHKIIVIFEKHGGEKADYSIRSFQSEKKLKIQVTIRDPETGQLITKEKEVNGPAGFITTTTDAQIHNENETRNLSLYADESQEQTERILQIINAKYQGKKGFSDEEIKKWHDLQRILKPYDILIPFVDELSKKFPKAPIRVRRDYDKILALIAVITLLHQAQREKRTIEDKEYLLATLADFHIAKVIFEGIFQKTIFELPPKSQLVIKVAKELVNESMEKITIGQMASRLGWNYDTVKKWFDPAFEKGYFDLVEEHRGSKGATYKPTDKEIEDKPILPKTEDLYKINPIWLSNTTIYNPLTGEILKFPEEEISTDAPMQ